MFEVGNIVIHHTYGKGEIISFNLREDSTVIVAFEKEHEIYIQDIIDKGNYFEDKSRLENTRFIDVHTSNLTKLCNLKNNLNSIPIKKVSMPYINHCYSCKKMLSSVTHIKCEACGWYKCECAACRCNYKEKIQ